MSPQIHTTQPSPQIHATKNKPADTRNNTTKHTKKIPKKIENAPPSKDPITPVNLIIIEYISIAVIFSFSLTEFMTLPCIAGTINALVIPVIPEAKYASNKKF